MTKQKAMLGGPAVTRQTRAGASLEQLELKES